MKNILLIAKAFPPTIGGVETYSEQVVRAYLRGGFTVTVITQRGNTRGWTTVTYPEGSVGLFDTGPGSQVIVAMRMLKCIRALLRQASFDFAHATTWRPALTLLVARCRPPIVITVHGREIFVVPRFLRPFMKVTLRKASLVVSVSSATRDRAKKRYGKSIDTAGWLIAGNGLSYRKVDRPSVCAAPADAKKIRLLTLARLVERKNISRCVEALQIIHAGGITNFEYRIAGTGPLLERLKEEVALGGLTEQVSFLGFVDSSEVPALYEWANIFLHPQVDLEDGDDFEGFGIAIADAMSFGCLAIAGTGSGPSDFVIDGVTGILVSGADIGPLTQLIQNAIVNFSDYHQIAENGKEYVLRELSWDKHTKRIVQALPSILTA